MVQGTIERHKHGKAISYYGFGRTSMYACQYDQRFSYCLYVPESYEEEGSTTYPLAVIVHGTNRPAQEYRDRFVDFGEREQCVVLAPLFPCGIIEPGELNNYKYIKFHDIRFDNVRVGPDAVFGDVGAGWSLITRMFAAERNGLDYYVRARYWLKLSADHLTRDGRRPTEVELTGLARHQARVDASRLLCCRALQSLQDGESDIAQASLAKWHCSETAQGIAWWAFDTLGLAMLEPGPRADSILEPAYREAPGMTISGGASEVLLDIVTGARLLEDIDSGA